MRWSVILLRFQGFLKQNSCGSIIPFDHSDVTQQSVPIPLKESTTTFHMTFHRHKLPFLKVVLSGVCRGSL